MQETMKTSEETVPAAPANELLSETAQWWVTELHSWLGRVEKEGLEQLNDKTGYGAYHRSRGLFENARHSCNGNAQHDKAIETLVIDQLQKAQDATPPGSARDCILAMLNSVKEVHAARQ